MHMDKDMQPTLLKRPTWLTQLTWRTQPTRLMPLTRLMPPMQPTQHMLPKWRMDIRIMHYPGEGPSFLFRGESSGRSVKLPRQHHMHYAGAPVVHGMHPMMPGAHMEARVTVAPHCMCLCIYST